MPEKSSLPAIRATGTEVQRKPSFELSLKGIRDGVAGIFGGRNLTSDEIAAVEIPKLQGLLEQASNDVEGLKVKRADMLLCSSDEVLDEIDAEIRTAERNVDRLSAKIDAAEQLQNALAVAEREDAVRREVQEAQEASLRIAAEAKELLKLFPKWAHVAFKYEQATEKVRLVNAAAAKAGISDRAQYPEQIARPDKHKNGASLRFDVALQLPGIDHRWAWNREDPATRARIQAEIEQSDK